jgi:hypothetical protein
LVARVPSKERDMGGREGFLAATAGFFSAGFFLDGFFFISNS